MEYISPSWSWVSAKKGALFPVWNTDTDKDLVVKIIDCQVKLVGNDPFGQLKDGYITLKGQLAPIRIGSVKFLSTYSRFSGFDVSFYDSGADRVCYWDYRDFEEITSHLESLYILIVTARPTSRYRGVIIGKGYDNKFMRYGMYVLDLLSYNNEPRKEAELLKACADFRGFTKDHDVSPLVCEKDGEYVVTIY